MAHFFPLSLLSATLCLDFLGQHRLYIHISISLVQSTQCPKLSSKYSNRFIVAGKAGDQEEVAGARVDGLGVLLLETTH